MPVGDWLYAHLLTGAWLNFWSGPGSDIGELGILGGLLALYRRHTCAQRGCWRWARHDLVDPDTHETHRLCARHHPRGAPTAEHLADVAARVAARQQSGDI